MAVSSTVTGETFHKVFNPPVDYKEEKITTNVKMISLRQKRRLDVLKLLKEPIIALTRMPKIWFDIEKVININVIFSDIEKVLTNLK